MGAFVLNRMAIAIALTLAPVCSACAAPAYDDLSRAFTVAASVQLLRINGVVVHSRAISSALAPLHACALIEQKWRSVLDSILPVICRREGDWLLVTRRVAEHLQTAQLQEDGGGSSGFLSELDPLAPMGPRPAPSLPLPARARLVNVVQSLEQRDSVTQFNIELPFLPATALARLRAGARPLGWAVAAVAGGNVLEFQRGSIAIRAIAVPVPHGTRLVLIEHQAWRGRP